MRETTLAATGFPAFFFKKHGRSGYLWRVAGFLDTFGFLGFRGIARCRRWWAFLF